MLPAETQETTLTVKGTIPPERAESFRSFLLQRLSGSPDKIPVATEVVTEPDGRTSFSFSHNSEGGGFYNLPAGEITGSVECAEQSLHAALKVPGRGRMELSIDNDSEVVASITSDDGNFQAVAQDLPDETTINRIMGTIAGTISRVQAEKNNAFLPTVPSTVGVPLQPRPIKVAF